MKKRFSNGLCLMKAYPPHKGHLHLIDTAIKQCQNVYVMICSLEREIIPGELRYNWLKNHYKNKKGVTIIHCDKELPQYPSECNSVSEFYNKYWVPTVYSYISSLDAVFTSEDYGDEFASYLKVKHVLVDKERVKFPVSGTKVRNNPLANWDFIPNNEKDYFTKRIAVLGPESVGKTTLTENLAAHFNCNFADEFGRTYTEKSGTDNLKVSDFEKIAKVQYKMNFGKQKKPSKFLFCDTEAITTKIFAEMYINKKNIPSIEEIIPKQKFDLYIVLDIDVPWVDDGTRDFQKQRKAHLRRIRKELELRKINYVLIGGDYQQRTERAIEEINKLL